MKTSSIIDRSNDHAAQSLEKQDFKVQSFINALAKRQIRKQKACQSTWIITQNLLIALPSVNQ